MNAIEEEKLPDKFNLGIWLKIGKYALRKWPLLLLIILTMLVTTYYDSSFVPTMNQGAIDALSHVTTATQDLWTTPIPVKMLFGETINFTYLTFVITEASMILLRSVSIFVTFFLTNYIDMIIMTDLRRDTFRRVQELSFSYFDHTNSGWLIARMNNDTGSIGDVLSWDIISIFWASFDMLFTIATMFTRNWVYALIVMASVPVVAIIVPIFERSLSKALAHRPQCL
jgi:ATP-binding cassette subfamily B protein